MSNLFILDACALIASLTNEPGAENVTSDHNDFEPIEKIENVKIKWFR
jgi:PIN domain nuclease of toxin-antitoxin system